jgi:hypothetical protein
VSSQYDRPFNAYYDLPTADALWAQPQESVSTPDSLQWLTMRRDSQQPLGPITPPTEAPSLGAGESSTDAGSGAPAHQGPGHIEYPRIPTIPTASDVRRSSRVSRAPVRYEP